MSNFNMGTAHDLAASDTDNDEFNWLMVTTTGNVVYETKGGNSYTMTAVPVGVWMPCGDATNITTASTASGFIVV